MGVEYCPICKKVVNTKETQVNIGIMGQYRVTKECLEFRHLISCIDVDPTTKMHRSK